MTLKIQLVQDNKILFEIPLTIEHWARDRLENELTNFENEFDRFSKLFHALAHQSRLRMMTRLFEEDDQTLAFSDFMKDLSLNPKIVWENTKKLREGGLLTKSKDGKYRIPTHGQAEFLMLSLALRRLLQTLRELEEL
jgi:DNA-binding transcriptional ArsR family regulator